MSALSKHLDRLFRWLASAGPQPPTQDVRIVELHADTVNLGDGTYHVRRDQLRKPLEYEVRFEELLQAGYPWLNMSCYGVHDGSLIVAIEVPGPRPLYPGHATPVNLSGPARTVDSVLTIE
jgi:hypothetical protein